MALRKSPTMRGAYLPACLHCFKATKGVRIGFCCGIQSGSKLTVLHKSLLVALKRTLYLIHGDSSIQVSIRRTSHLIPYSSSTHSIFFSTHTKRRQPNSRTLWYIAEDQIQSIQRVSPRHIPSADAKLHAAIIAFGLRSR